MQDALKTWQLYDLWAVFFLNTTAGLAILSDARVMAGEIGGAFVAMFCLQAAFFSLMPTLGVGSGPCSATCAWW